MKAGTVSIPLNNDMGSLFNRIMIVFHFLFWSTGLKGFFERVELELEKEERERKSLSLKPPHTDGAINPPQVKGNPLGRGG